MAMLDRLDLNLDRTYMLEEFEGINEQLKTQTLETGEEPVDLFELDASGKLIPIPQTPFCKELAVAEIIRQIGMWNIYTNQGGGVTASQGGFNFETGRGGRTIQDVQRRPCEWFDTFARGWPRRFRIQTGPGWRNGGASADPSTGRETARRRPIQLSHKPVA